MVGPQGSKNIAAGGDSDLYADGLGRVRVRFPWQREVPTGANQGGSTEPLETDRRTCWVSVSESWAGANFGTQFLPRIGQEVIVSFLDGDPERPIITGRRYNADHGYSNLPFPPNEVDVEPTTSMTGMDPDRRTTSRLTASRPPAPKRHAPTAAAASRAIT